MRLCVFLLLVAAANAQNDRSGNFPVKVSLSIGAPGGAVAGLTTTVYAASQKGEIFLADIKSGNGTILNRGGDGQTLGGICLDSRNDKTLYGAGRGTGLLYAFTARGKLVRRFVISDPSTSKAPHYISHCVQTRYYLIVVDAYQNKLFKLDLADSGPNRGKPPGLREGEKTDATEVELGGDWEPAAQGQLGPITLEWSRLWNETGFILNHNTGKVYLFPLNAVDEAKLERMYIGGKQKTFPGTTHMLFDSSNERILYLVQSTRNAIAVIEIDEKEPTKAMYIRTLTSPLINSPMAVAEYGEFLYTLNGDLGAQDRMKGNYNLAQISKHFQELAEDYDEDEPFTPVGKGKDPPQEEQYDSETLAEVLTAPPAPIGFKAVAPLDEVETPKNRAEATPVGTKDDDGGDDDTSDGANVDVQPTGLPGVFSGEFDDSNDGGSCFPADATVALSGGGARRMDELKIGDHILVGPGLYSPVFMFTHKVPNVESNFVRIHYSHSGTISVSSGHYVYANGALVPAASIVPGDILTLSLPSSSCTSPPCSTTAPVTQIERIRSTGLYNPQTVHGDIVVDGVVASTYTTAVEPALAHALLAPLRLLERFGVRTTSLEAGAGVLSKLMPRRQDAVAVP